MQDDLFFRDVVHSYLDNPRFLRRDWLTVEVKARLSSSNCHFVLLIGEPGSGKSALISQLANDHPTWPVYFIRRDQRTPLGEISTRSFLLRIGFQLSLVYPELFTLEQVRLVVEQRVGEVSNKGEIVGAEIDKIRSSPFHQTVMQIQQEVQRADGKVTGLHIHEWIADPRLLDENDLQNMALLDPVRALYRLRPKERIVILIDALDELPYHQSERTLLHWLINCPQLPDNVHFVLTSRAPDDVLITFIEKQTPFLSTFTIAPKDDRVQKDLQIYAQQLVKVEEVASILTDTERSVDGFLARILDKANGNIGYLDAIGRGIDQALSFPEGKQILRELLALRELPNYIQGLYAFFLHQIKGIAAAQVVKVKDPQSGRFGLVEAWPEVYYPILAVLTITLEPLNLDQIKALTGTLAERPYVVQALAWLGQFLNKVGNRYQFYHSTMAEFLTAEATRAQPETTDLYINTIETHRELASQLGYQLEAIWEDSLEDVTEQARRKYARKYYVTHLFQAQEWQQLFSTLDSAEYGWAKLRYDPSSNSFAQDLDLGRQATIRDSWTFEKRVALLPSLFRYTLLRRSLSSRADQYSVELFQSLLFLDHESKVLGLVELLTEPRYKAKILILAAQHFSHQESRQDDANGLFLRVFNIVSSINNSIQRTDALQEFTEMLAEVGQWERAEQMARTIEKDFQRAVALERLAVALAEAGQWERAEQMARTIEDASKRGETLGRLAVALAEAGQWERAEQMARTIEDASERGETLGRLAGMLAEVGQWERAEQMARTIEKDFQRYQRGSDLKRLAVALAEARQWERAEQVVRAIEEAGYRTEALGRLATELGKVGQRERAEDYWLQAEETAQAIKRSGRRTVILGKLAEMLAEARQWERAEHMARTIEEAGKRAAALGRLAAASGLAGQWERAEHIAWSVEESWRAIALSELVAALAKAGQWERAEQMARTIEKDFQRAVALERLAVALAEAGQWERAEQMARTIEDASKRGETLGRLAGMLAEAGQWERAEQMARTIEKDFQRAVALKRLAVALAEAGQWERAEQMARTIEDVSKRGETLGRLAVALAEAGQWERAKTISIEAEQAILVQASHVIKSDKELDKALRRLAVALAEAKQWECAGQVAQSIDDVGQRAYALSMLVKLLTKAGQWERTEQVNRMLERLQDTKALVRVAEAFAEVGQWERAEHIAWSIEESWRGFALWRLAEMLAEAGQWERAEEMVRTIERDFWRDPALTALVKKLAEIRQWERAEQIAQTIGDAAARVEALGSLAAALSKTGERKRARDYWLQAEEMARTTKKGYLRAEALTELVAALAEVGQWERAEEMALSIEEVSRRGVAQGKLVAAFAEVGKWAQAEQVVRAIEDKDERDEALGRLVEALGKERQWEQAEGTARTIKKISKRGEAQGKLVEAFAEAGEWARAEQVVWVIEDAEQRTEALGRLASVILTTKEYEKLLSLVQRSWFQAETRAYILQLLPLVFGFIALKPEIGVTLFETFKWVDSFLGG